MANIPCVAALSLLFVSVYGFRVPPSVNENPDLIIDEDLNLVEPKMDFWNVLLRPKAKTTFKSILKLLNAFDARDRYSVVDEQAPPSISHQPAPISTDFIVVKKDEVRFQKGQEQLVIPSEPDAGIVSEEAPDRESLSEEHPSRIAVGSISMETNENSDESSKTTKINSSQHSESSKESSSEEGKIKTSKPEVTNNQREERLRHLETLMYEADVPKSLHHFETDKPRYQHSIRDGWIY